MYVSIIFLVYTYISFFMKENYKRVSKDKKYVHSVWKHPHLRLKASIIFIWKLKKLNNTTKNL